MLITKEVEVGLSGNIQYYEERGYKIPRWTDNQGRKNKVKQGTKIEVKVEHLSPKSMVNVVVQCDGCEKILLQVKWADYQKCVKEDGKYYCAKCASNGFKKWTSFYEWCYENLSQEDADKLMLRWDYEKNKISPKEVTYGSHGLNGKGYWFKCIDHPEHKSEICDIHSFTGGQKGSLKCGQCNTIAVTHPHLIEYLVNKEDAYKYSYGSNELIPMKCPTCGHERKYRIPTLIEYGFSCKKCSDGVSYPEKFTFNVLEQVLNKNFETQLAKTTFEWCGRYRYDFYINIINCIIETHGRQHYEEHNGGSWGSLREVKENDKQKELLAKQNGIKDDHYIIIDCRESTLEWIKKSIMNSKLPTLLNFKEEDIDWLKCHEYACSSLVKIACDMWNSESCNILEVAKKIKRSQSSVWKYLKQGVELGWCNYNPQEEFSKKRKKKIICLTTGEIFNSIKDASCAYKIDASNVSNCCRHITKSSGRLPDGTKLVWMYYDEYIKQQEQFPTLSIV